MTIHSNDFQERLARIEAGTSNTRHTLFVGMDESFVVPPKPKAQRRTNPLANVAFAIGRFWAVSLGGIAVIILAVARYWAGMDEPMPGDPINDQVAVYVLSLGLAVYLGRKFFRNREGLLGLYAAGALVMTVGMHNVVHLAPQFFSVICSPAWTGKIMSSAPLFSVIIRGVSIPLI